MNYRHAYHAGNFADVLKHAVLALVIEHLKLKPAPFRVIDTHAGTGLYDLASPEAGKTGEWRDGIGRLLGDDAAPLPAEIADVLAPYLDVVRSVNSPGRLESYPGSPLIAERLLRPVDRLVLNELHPDDRAALAMLFRRNEQVKVLGLDAWIAVKSLLPPKERRGLVLIDPPYEARDEIERLATGFAEAVKRFATGTYMMWYPIKDPAFADGLDAAVVGNGIARRLRAELLVRPPLRSDRLNGCGLLLVNPPWTLEATLARLLPVLAQRLTLETGGRFRLETAERA